MGLEEYQVEKAAGYEIAEVSADAIERANVDVQVATAKQYPRNVQRAIDNSIAIATMDEDTAQMCGYALPRGGKPITGPSVHLAKIIASNWGNLRTEAKVVQITDKQVISRGTCWDLENNVASAFEVRRSIVGKYGRYTDDMITVTGNAANSIAYRNAVFAVIPKAVTEKVYLAAQRCMTGDLTNEDKIIAARTKAIKFLENEYGISENEVVKLCGRQTVNQIRAEEIALLRGVCNSLRDGDTTVDELMKPYRESKEAKKEAVRKQVMKEKTVVDKSTGEIFNQEEGQ